MICSASWIYNSPHHTYKSLSKNSFSVEIVLVALHCLVPLLKSSMMRGFVRYRIHLPLHNTLDTLSPQNYLLLLEMRNSHESYNFPNVFDSQWFCTALNELIHSKCPITQTQTFWQIDLEFDWMQLDLKTKTKKTTNSKKQSTVDRMKWTDMSM